MINKIHLKLNITINLKIKIINQLICLKKRKELIIMKEKAYVEDFQYCLIVKQMCRFHCHDDIENKLNYLIFDLQQEEKFQLDRM